MHYYYIKNPNTIITHDGNVQTGIVHMSESDFLRMVQVDYQKTYWVPDPYSIRYKSKSFQNHLYFQQLWKNMINEEHIK